MTASALTFIRMGAWVWAILPVLWLYPSTRQLQLVLLAWLTGGLLALIPGFVLILRAAGPWQSWTLDRDWLRRGFFVSAMYLASSFAFRATFTLDRYFVTHLAGPEALGAYVLFIGMATSVITIIEPAILSFLSPRVVAAWQSGRRGDYDRVVRELYWSIFAVSTVGVIGIGLAAPLAVDWIGKPTYAESLGLLWILLAMAWVCANGISLDCVLYARARDRGLTAATFAALLAFLALVPLLGRLDPAYAVATALLVAFAFSYLLRLALVLRRTSEAPPSR